MENLQQNADIDPKTIADAVEEIYRETASSETTVVLGHVAGKFSLAESNAVRHQALNDLPSIQGLNILNIETVAHSDQMTYLVYRSTEKPSQDKV